MQSLDRFAVALAGERPRREPVTECLACGNPIYPGDTYYEIWPSRNGGDVVCSAECARWAWHVLEQEDRLLAPDERGWQIRVAEEVGAPWWD